MHLMLNIGTRPPTLWSYVEECCLWLIARLSMASSQTNTSYIARTGPSLTGLARNVYTAIWGRAVVVSARAPKQVLAVRLSVVVVIVIVAVVVAVIYHSSSDAFIICFAIGYRIRIIGPRAPCDDSRSFGTVRT